MWDLPGPGLEPVSPALAGGFSTTVPPGKPWFSNFNVHLNPLRSLEKVGSDSVGLKKGLKFCLFNKFPALMLV